MKILLADKWVFLLTEGLSNTLWQIYFLPSEQPSGYREESLTTF